MRRVVTVQSHGHGIWSLEGARRRFHLQHWNGGTRGDGALQNEADEGVKL